MILEVATRLLPLIFYCRKMLTHFHAGQVGAPPGKAGLYLYLHPLSSQVNRAPGFKRANGESLKLVCSLGA